MTRDLAATRFRDRAHAGRVLATAPPPYAPRPPGILLALPRGGGPVGHAGARAPGGPLDGFVVPQLRRAGPAGGRASGSCVGRGRRPRRRGGYVRGAERRGRRARVPDDARAVSRRRPVVRGFLADDRRGGAGIAGAEFVDLSRHGQIIVVDMPTPLEQWVDECSRITRPKAVHWCDGSTAEYQRLVQEMLQTRTLIELNQRE